MLILIISSRIKMKTSVSSFGLGPRTSPSTLLANVDQSEGLQIYNRLFQQDFDHTYSFFYPCTGHRLINDILCGFLIEVIDNWADNSI